MKGSVGLKAFHPSPAEHPPDKYLYRIHTQIPEYLEPSVGSKSVPVGYLKQNMVPLISSPVWGYVTACLRLYIQVK